MIEVTDFRDAMSLLAGAVNVVTTAGASGRFGFTASSVCSVTDSPPSLLVCMNRSARSHTYFIDNKILAVNVLNAQQQKISSVFSSPIKSEERFEHGDWTTLKTGSPILTEALVSFDCEIDQMHEVGTHTVFICRILAIQKSKSHQGLAYFNRSYHNIGEETPAFTKHRL